MDKSVEVEIEEIRAAIVYKSKIIGFSQEDANKLQTHAADLNSKVAHFIL